MSVSPPSALGPRTLLDVVMFRCDDASVTRAEVRRWATRRDPSFVARVARRAALGALDPADDPTLDAEVEADAAEFRYARALESADSLMEWLTSHGLTVESWWESIRRSVLERRFSGRPLTPADGIGTEEHEDDEGVALADLVVADLLSPAAEALARRCAVARSLSPITAPITAPRDVDAANDAAHDAAHDAIERAWVPWRSALMTTEALQQAVSREQLSWIALDFVESRWPSADAASEAVSCVLVDRTDLREVGREAAADVADRACLLSEVPAAWHDALLTAARGDVVGPIASPPHWVVIQLQDKRPPALEEPLVRAAAERDVERRAAAPLVDRHVIWLERRP